MMDRKIFISYSRKDNQIMHHVRKTLEQAGISVWIDEGLRPGTKDWQIAIEREIEACDAMVVLLSQDSCESEWVRREINRAYHLGRSVLPLVIKNVPASAIPLVLENTQHINASSNLDTGIALLLTELKNRGWIDPTELEKAPKPQYFPRGLWYIGGGVGIILLLALAFWGGSFLSGALWNNRTPQPEATTQVAEVAIETPRLATATTTRSPTTTVTPQSVTAKITHSPTTIQVSHSPTDTVLLPSATIAPSKTPEELPALLLDDYGVSMALIPAGSF